MRPSWDEWEAANPEIREVAEKFILANCNDPYVAMQFFSDAKADQEDQSFSDTETDREDHWY
jgi:putative transposase